MDVDRFDAVIARLAKAPSRRDALKAARSRLHAYLGVPALPEARKPSGKEHDGKSKHEGKHKGKGHKSGGKGHHGKSHGKGHHGKSHGKHKKDKNKHKS